MNESKYLAHPDEIRWTETRESWRPRRRSRRCPGAASPQPPAPRLWLPPGPPAA